MGLGAVFVVSWAATGDASTTNRVMKLCMGWMLQLQHPLRKRQSEIMVHFSRDRGALFLSSPAAAEAAMQGAALAARDTVSRRSGCRQGRARRAAWIRPREGA